MIQKPFFCFFPISDLAMFPYQHIHIGLFSQLWVFHYVDISVIHWHRQGFLVVDFQVL